MVASCRRFHSLSLFALAVERDRGRQRGRERGREGSIHLFSLSRISLPSQREKEGEIEKSPSNEGKQEKGERSSFPSWPGFPLLSLTSSQRDNNSQNYCSTRSMKLSLSHCREWERWRRGESRFSDDEHLRKRRAVKLLSSE